MNRDLEAANLLTALPPGARSQLLAAHDGVVDNFRREHWEQAVLQGGKLCEAAYGIVDGYIRGSVPDRITKPQNMVEACRALEKLPSAGPLVGERSVRINIPRVILGVYEIRNNRGVGHIGGDVNPNKMDATFVLNASNWLVAELVRIFHDTDTASAEAAVDRLVERRVPLVWSVEDRKRVLNPSLKFLDQMMVLLYSEERGVGESDLVAWLEYSNPSVFRREVLARAHRQRLVEYDRRSRVVRISPRGLKYVEDNALLG